MRKPNTHTHEKHTQPKKSMLNTQWDAIKKRTRLFVFCAHWARYLFDLSAPAVQLECDVRVLDVEAIRGRHPHLDLVAVALKFLDVPLPFADVFSLMLTFVATDALFCAMDGRGVG